jgi:hypothetical protein
MIDVERLAAWLEEDGHVACAHILLMAAPEGRAVAARAAADCMEVDPDGYRDDLARAMPGQLREWADSQEPAQAKAGK